MAKKKTPVQEAFQALLSGLDWDTNESIRHDQQEFAFGILARLASETRTEAREEVAQRLDVLGDGRMECVFKKKVETSNDIDTMGGVQAMIYGEATGAKWLARIIRGESDRGWLPSWRW